MSQYASIGDAKNLALPANAFALPIGMTQEVFDAAVNAQLAAISARVDSYLRVPGTYAVPLAGAVGPPNTYPGEFVKAVCDIFAFEFLCWRGFNPDEFDATYQQKWKSTLDWLKEIRDGKAVVDLPPPDPDPDPDPGATAVSGAGIATRPKRGW